MYVGRTKTAGRYGLVGDDGFAPCADHNRNALEIERTQTSSAVVVVGAMHTTRRQLYCYSYGVHHARSFSLRDDDNDNNNGKTIAIVVIMG